MLNGLTLAAMVTFIAALLEIQNAFSTGQTLFGVPLTMVLAGAVLFWLGRKRQVVM